MNFSFVSEKEIKKQQTVKKQFNNAASAIATLSGTLSVIRYASDVMMEHKDFHSVIALLDEYAEKIYEEIFDDAETASLTGGDVA